VCGEFLSQEALDLLMLLGLDPAILGAVRLTGVRLARASSVTEAVLPFHAMSLTRKRLDEELLQLACRAGVQVQRGVRATKLERTFKGWLVHADGENEAIASPSAFLATGKHDLPSERRPAGKQTGMVGFKMYYRLDPKQAKELSNYVELVLFRGGYGGLQPVEDDAANLCCLVHRDELQRLGGRWEALLESMQRACPHIAMRLTGATALLEKPLAISSVPYGYLREHAEDGLWKLGDQAAVIPSFTGDGMSIALHSGRLAAETYLNGGTAADYQTNLYSQVKRQLALATMLSRALVWAPTRQVLGLSAGIWPGALTLVARHTRIQERSRLI
jgi:flavin-dependent dehydrogenase